MPTGRRGETLRPGSQLVAEGKAKYDGQVGLSRASRLHGVASEYAYKRQAIRQNNITYHAHFGLSTWQGTRQSLARIVEDLEEHGHQLDRFGLCLERNMSLPEDARAAMPKETGPRLDREAWAEVAQAVPSQPHLGDFMIGTPASEENAVNALESGITTIGNLGQYFTFEVTGGYDDVHTTEATVRALGVMAKAKPAGAMLHSYLDDGPAMQLDNYGNYLGWATLEHFVVEELLGVRLAHCFGGLVPQPEARIVISLALSRIHRGDVCGSMIYGNTVDYTKDANRNVAVLSAYLLTDISAQLHSPTGHAINPVPLTENIRIPSADDVVEVQLIAREIETEARRSYGLYDWARLERDADLAAEYAKDFASAVLATLEEQGVDVNDPAELLLALRQADVQELERRAGRTPPSGAARLQPWKASTVDSLGRGLRACGRRLNGCRIVVAPTDVHDLVSSVLTRELRTLGAEIVALPTHVSATAAARTAIAEDADALIVATYNGIALTIATELARALEAEEYDGITIFGGVLNQDDHSGLPRDVTREVSALGFVCVHDVEEVIPVLLNQTVDVGRPATSAH